MPNEGPRYHVIDHWRTPATAYPRASEGDWSISDREQGEGIYPMQERGSFYYTPNPITLTVLKEGERVWFTDEPRQMYALAEIGLFRAWGNVIVGGLGLGLIQHFLGLNPHVDHVLTVERAPELRRLVWPHVQVGDLTTGDFYEELPRLAAAGERVDTIITDFIFGWQGPETWSLLGEQRRFCRAHYPDATFLEHGYQRRIDGETVAAATSSFLSAGAAPGLVKIVR